MSGVPVLPGPADPQPKGQFDINIPEILPHRQVFTIQVGGETFRLSGASLSSDGPSYFTNFFLKYINEPTGDTPTLYVDRSAKVFRVISLHLQGYWVDPIDDAMYSYLIADASYFHLPKLTHLLSTSEIFVRIGATQFRIPRTVFSGAGDSPNYFTVGFSTFFGSGIRTQVAFPSELIRPLPLAPAAVPLRSAELFQDLLNVLGGNCVNIRSETHRESLIKEARYYRFRGLEQRLIRHAINNNLLRGVEEIIVDLKNVHISKGVEIVCDGPGSVRLTPSDSSDVDPQKVQSPSSEFRYVGYKRPFIDDSYRELVFQITEEQLIVRQENGKWVVELHDASYAPFKELAAAVESRLDFATVQLPEVTVKDAAAVIDGNNVDLQSLEDSESSANANGKRQWKAPATLYLTKSQWRIDVVPGEPLFRLLRFEAYTSQSQKNTLRDFA